MLSSAAAALVLGGCGVNRLSRAGTDRDTRGAEQPVAYTGGRAFLSSRGEAPGTGGGFEAATVVVAGGRIVAVGADVDVPDGARQVDVSGLSLLPGFVDTHVHVQFSTPQAILGGGVTTVRDLGSPPDQALALAGAGPLRVLAAGRILTPRGGYPSRSWGSDGTAREIRGVRDAATAVREQVRAGATVVKVALEPAAGPVFDAAVLRAIVGTAHAEQRRVTAHVGGREAFELALAAGIDELAHVPLYDVTPVEMVRAAEAGIALVPTLQIRGPDPSARRALAAVLDAGGRVLYGSDLGNAGTAPGIEVGEVRAMLDAGMTPAQVLAAATSDAADYLGLRDVGRIEAGAAADLIAVGGRPDQDAAAYDDVRLVLAGGAAVVDRLQ